MNREWKQKMILPRFFLHVVVFKGLFGLLLLEKIFSGFLPLHNQTAIFLHAHLSATGLTAKKNIKMFHSQAKMLCLQGKQHALSTRCCWSYLANPLCTSCVCGNMVKGKCSLRMLLKMLHVLPFGSSVLPIWHFFPILCLRNTA